MTVRVCILLLLTALLLPVIASKGQAGGSQGKKSVVVLVGTARLSIPAPFGFVEASEALPALRKEAESFIYPGNELLAFFIPTEDFQDMVGGQDKPMNRYLFVQTLTHSKASQVGADSFIQTKNQYREMSNERLGKAGEDVNRLMRDRGKDLSKYPEIYAGLSLGRMVGLGVIDETKRSITLGMLGSIKYSGEGKKERIKTLVGAEVVLLINGKVITAQMYNTYRSVDDFDWLKEMVRDWTRAVLGSN